MEISIREATAADTAAIAGVHTRSWQSAYRGIIGDEVLDALSVAQREGDWRKRLLAATTGDPIPFTLVAELAGALRGFCNVARLDNDADATIGALYVEPGHLRAGIGSALLDAALARLRAAGRDDVVLWVLEANHGARAFYERFGLVADGARQRFAGAPELRMRLCLASSGVRFAKPHPGALNTMPEVQTVQTDQAAREASGAHPYGRYLEEFEVGAVYKHWPAKTVTEADDHLFCLITMNHHPLHINDVYAGNSQQGRNVVVGPLVYSLALGMSVSDVSGKAIANLATEELSHPAPVFHGDTLFVESEVLEVKESRSKPDRGTVKVHTRVLNQDGVLVAQFKRVVLVPRKYPG
jgi:acyl dehydratase/ribosomal protein S18 acetylase RimI-like enzyme